jgi:hypothetical protein
MYTDIEVKATFCLRNHVLLVLTHCIYCRLTSKDVDFYQHFHHQLPSQFLSSNTELDSGKALDYTSGLLVLFSPKDT